MDDRVTMRLIISVISLFVVIVLWVFISAGRFDDYGKRIETLEKKVLPAEKEVGKK